MGNKNDHDKSFAFFVLINFISFAKYKSIIKN